MMSFRIFCLVFVLCHLGVSVFAQSPGQVKDTLKGGVIIIDDMRHVIQDDQGIESVQWISKGFQLRIDSTYLYGDSAIILGMVRVFAYKDIVIQQGDSLEVFTDTLFYSRIEDIADLKGEVVLRQGTKQLWTTDLKYYLGERRGEYHKGGILVDRDLQVSSVSGIYNADKEEIFFKDSVVVLHPKFTLAADSMTYLAAESRVLFTGPTLITTEQAKIYCESGYYDLLTGESVFVQNVQYLDGDKTGTADTIRYDDRKGEVTMLGNVVVEELQRRITGDYLRYIASTGETWIKGDPGHYEDEKTSVDGPEILYNEKTKKVSISGGGIIRDGDQIIKAKSTESDQVTGYSKASGDVIWSDTTRLIGIEADEVIASKKEGFVLAYSTDTKRPRFYSIIEGDTLFIAADTLRMFSVFDSLSGDTIRHIQAYHDVRIYKSDMQGKMDSLIYDDQDSVFVFFGTPVLWSDTTQFSADSIRMTLRNKQIHEIEMHRQALILSEQLGTYYDQIKGRIIVASFDSSELKNMWVTGNAESVYYTRDDHQAYIGVNKTICSKMHFTFLAGAIQALRYYGENTSNMLPMNEADHTGMRLEGFQWRMPERPNSPFDLLY